MNIVFCSQDISIERFTVENDLSTLFSILKEEVVVQFLAIPGNEIGKDILQYIEDNKTLVREIFIYGKPDMDKIQVFFKAYKLNKEYGNMPFIKMQHEYLDKYLLNT